MSKWLVPLIGLAAALAAIGAAYALAGDGSGRPEPKDSDLPAFSAMCAEEVPDCNDTLVIGRNDEGTIEPDFGEDGPYLVPDRDVECGPDQGIAITSDGHLTCVGVRNLPDTPGEVEPQHPKEVVPLGSDYPHSSDDGFGLEVELRHGKLQEPVGLLGAELAVEEQDTYAGLWIEWTPQFHVVVRFTRDGEETIRPYIENAPFADVVEVRTARATLVELRNAHAAADRAVSDLGVAFDSGTNVKENRVELYVIDPEALNAALQGASMQLPEHVEVVKADTLAAPG